MIPAKKIPSYHFVLKQGKKKIEKTDAYAVDSLFDGVDMTQFSNGIHDTVYEKLGAHPMTIEGVKGTYFAVWAPEAKAVSVVGDFNDWQAARNPMRYLEAAGIYELFVPSVSAGDLYKYEIWGADGKRVMKADPYGNYAERRPATASITGKMKSGLPSVKNGMRKRSRCLFTKWRLAHLKSRRMPKKNFIIIVNLLR